MVEGSDTVSQKGAKPLPPVVAVPSTAGAHLVSTSAPSAPASVTVPHGSGSTTHPVVPVKDLDLKEKSSDSKTGAKGGNNIREEYGYIVTNQR